MTRKVRTIAHRTATAASALRALHSLVKVDVGRSVGILRDADVLIAGIQTSLEQVATELARRQGPIDRPDAFPRTEWVCVLVSAQGLAGQFKKPSPGAARCRATPVKVAGPLVLCEAATVHTS